MSVANYIEQKFESLGINPDQANMIFFWKPYPKTRGYIDEACCCQWWQGRFNFNGVDFNTAEHAMMYGKAQMFGDQDIMKKILAEPKPHEAKKLGRLVKGFDESVWSKNNYNLVRDINVAKFNQIPSLKDWLLSHPYNTVFVEASPFDSIWGIKRENNGVLDLTQTRNWAGYNKLGFALTDAFQILKQQG